MTRNTITAAAASILALGLAFGAAPALAAKTSASIGMQLEPPNLDPTGGAAAAIDEVVYANVFEGLTRFGADGSILPALAENWEISEDGLTYTFKLRTGVTFHDGSGFEAEDVKFSLDRARADDSTNAQKALFADIASVEVVDPTTVKVTLSQPNGSFLFNMAWGDAVIVAPETAADNAAKPVGTGPFTLSEWVKGDRVELARNPDYWGEPVRLDQVTFKFISDPTAAFAAMMAGDIDAFPTFPAPENLVQFEADPRFEVIIGSSEGETILAMNNRKAPLDNIKVRQAITHAIDRQAIIDGAMFGYGHTDRHPFRPAQPGLCRSDRAVGLRSREVEGAARRGRRQGSHAQPQAAPAKLCPPWRRDHRRAIARGWHRHRDHQCRMGAVARGRLQGQELRSHRHLAHRADGYRHLWPRRLLLPVRRSGLPGDHGRSRQRH